MAYLDGEAPTTERAALETHLASCRACQHVAAEFRGVTERTDLWNVEAAPGTLRAPRVPRTRVWQLPAFSWRPAYLVVSFGGVAVTVLAVGTLVPYANRTRTTARAVALEAPTTVAAPKSVRQGQIAREGPAVDKLRASDAPGGRSGNPQSSVREEAMKSQPRALIRTATLRIVTPDFDKARPAIERLAAETGGFIDQMTAAGTPGTVRTLTGTLRVPANRLAEALARLRQLGQVTEDTQGAEDVTDQIVDLDARLANARATERRLTDILNNRTGKLSDVLDVERELSRVRLEIERMDGERANIGRRVNYAAIAIEIGEERKAVLEGPLSLPTRLRIAAADGLDAAFESSVGAVLFVLRAGPSGLLWLTTAAIAWSVTRRVVRGQTARRP
jgi:hypothetical protein